MFADLYPDLTFHPAETQDDRHEKIVLAIIRRNDTSEKAIEALGFILMEAPADFDCCNDEPPFYASERWLATQSQEVRDRFRKACEAHPTRAYARRINALLRLPVDQKTA